MPSVPSIDHQKTATVFRSVEQSHLQDALPVAEDRLREVLDAAETLPDVPLLAALVGRIQAGATQRLIAADNAHDDQLANDVEPRQLRDEAGERVRKKLVEVRRIAAGLFGPERSAEILGAPGQTAQVTESERLWRQAEDTIVRLEDPEFTVPEMTTESLQFDPASLASELRTENGAFRAALDAVALEQRKAEASLEVKKARIDDAKRIDAACRRFYEGFFLLAGRPDLADRLARALRRGTRRAAPGTVDAPPSPDAGSGADVEPPEGDEASPGGEPPVAPSSED